MLSVSMNPEGALRHIRAHAKHLYQFILKQAAFEHWDSVLQFFREMGFFWVESWVAPYYHTNRKVCLHFNDPRGGCTKASCTYQHVCIVCGLNHNAYSQRSGGAYRCTTLHEVHNQMKALGLVWGDVDALARHLGNTDKSYLAREAQEPQWISHDPSAMPGQRTPSTPRSLVSSTSSFAPSIPSTPSTPRSVASTISASTTRSDSTDYPGWSPWSETPWSNTVHDDVREVLRKALKNTWWASSLCEIRARMRAEEIDLRALRILEPKHYLSLGVHPNAARRIAAVVRQLPEPVH